MADTTLTYTNQTGDIAWKHHPLDGRVPYYEAGQHPLNQKLTRQQILAAKDIRRPQAPETPDDPVTTPVFDRCRELGHAIRARRDDAQRTIRYSHSTEEGMYLFELTYLAAAQHPGSLAGALADWLGDLPGHGALVPDQVTEIDPTKGEWQAEYNRTASEVQIDTIMRSSSVQNWVYEQGVARLIDPSGVTHFVTDLPPGETVHIPQLGGPTWTLTATNGALDVTLDAVWDEH